MRLFQTSNFSAYEFKQELVTAEQEKAIQNAAKVGNPDLKGLKLLVVEHDEINRRFIQALLDLTKASYKLVKNSKAALRAAYWRKYDAILLDIVMPGIRGTDIAGQIISKPGPNQHTPVIALTANVFASDLKACKEAGIHTFLGKPYASDTLFTAIQQAVDNT